jgi:ABC-type antimicrobial peptide transport system permease subunit
MKIGDTLSYAIRHIMTRPRRSALSVLGIVIGVVAIVVVLSVSVGFREDLKEQLAAFGPDMMIVVPVSSPVEAIGGSFARPPSTGKILQEDADDIESIDGVRRISRVLYGKVRTTFKGKNSSLMVYGVDREFFEQYEDYIEIESGRIFKESERGVAVFGADAATEVYGKDKVEIGSVIQILGDNYRVVGILKRIGASFSATDDAAVFVSFDDGEDVHADSIIEEEVGYVSVQIEEGHDPDEIKASIESRLSANRRGEGGEKDFSVVTSDQVVGVVSNILFASEIVLGAVTLIAGLVAGIGIANTMLVNVLERIREIGILRSLGASKGTVISIFVAESVILSISGGIIGLLVSYAGLELIERFFGVPVIITTAIVVYVFVFSFLTGLAAGAYPAYRASKLQPLKALRYE